MPNPRKPSRPPGLLCRKAIYSQLPMENFVSKIICKHNKTRDIWFVKFPARDDHHFIGSLWVPAWEFSERYVSAKANVHVDAAPPLSNMICQCSDSRAMFVIWMFVMAIYFCMLPAILPLEFVFGSRCRTSQVHINWWRILSRPRFVSVRKTL
jgi:hypothetical protein